MNPAARRLLSLPDGPIAGDYRTVIDEPALSQTIDECLSSGRAILRRTVHLPEGGDARRRDLASRVSPLFDAAGQLHGAVCLFTDLTAVQQLEEQLRLKESLATVGELTAGIAHEFRNGLATIHGYSKLLDPDALPPDVGRASRAFARKPCRSARSSPTSSTSRVRRSSRCPTSISEPSANEWRTRCAQTPVRSAAP